MTNYREILRLESLGFSERNIALNCSCSRNTVSKIEKKLKNGVNKMLLWTEYIEECRLNGDEPLI